MLLALFGFGKEAARFDFAWKEPPLPATYVVSIMAIILLFELIPYIEEFLRGLRANHGALVPPRPARETVEPVQKRPLGFSF
jgi:hypothetical protein